MVLTRRQLLKAAVLTAASATLPAMPGLPPVVTPIARAQAVELILEPVVMRVTGGLVYEDFEWFTRLVTGTSVTGGGGKVWTYTPGMEGATVS